jgi:hypothetical protein
VAPARTALIVGGGLAAGVLTWWFLYGRHDEPGGVLGDVNQILASLTSLGRGTRLTRAPYDTTTGVVPGSPDQLAAQAGLDVEAYSLARAISSEEGRSSAAIKVAVGWSIRNYAAKHGRTITAQVTRANNSDHAGSYGTQKDIDPSSPDQGKSDRYCSTALDPYDQDGQIAAGILSGAIPDTTNGADQFDRPAGEKNPDQIAQNRIDAGAVQVDVAGVDGDAIRFWRTA